MVYLCAVRHGREYGTDSTRLRGGHARCQAIRRSQASIAELSRTYGLNPETVAKWKKRRVLLGNYFPPGDLERQIADFVDHYNNHRYRESPGNLTPDDVYHGRGQKILRIRDETKKQTIRKRRLPQERAAA